MHSEIVSYLNSRLPYVAVNIDDNIRSNVLQEFQLEILNLSYGNLEQCFYQRLYRTNRLVKNKNPYATRMIHLPNKILIKK